MRLILCLLIIDICLILFTVLNIIKVNGNRNKNPSLVLKVHIPNQGMVIGCNDKTAWSNQNFLQFCGIPYAEPPIGPLRYKAPKQKTAWSDLVDGRKMGRNCPGTQRIPNKKDGGNPEDCLNLCVYTKNLTAQYPVLTYIIGDEFNNGTGLDYSPKYLLEKNIVLVVPHFRVGVFGWGFSKSKHIPGNMALLDIQFVLKWIQENIWVFGGDPTNVTVMGHSGGACTTSALMISPKTEFNYFQRAIVMSGSVLSPWAINKDPLGQLQRICKKLCCLYCSNHKSLVLCLEQANVDDILKASKDEFFSPVVGDIHKVLPKKPKHLIRHLKRNYTVLTGFTTHDGSFLIASYYDKLKKSNVNVSNLTVKELAKGMLSKIYENSDQKYIKPKHFFTRILLRSSNHHQAIPGYMDLCSTILFKMDIVKLANALLWKNFGPLYLYSFDYQGQHTHFGYGLPTKHYPFYGGVHHSDELLYLFARQILNQKDTCMAKKMVELWTTFTINGIPSHKNAPKILQMQNESGPYFSINIKTKIKYNVETEFHAAFNAPEKSKLIRLNETF